MKRFLIILALVAVGCGSSTDNNDPGAENNANNSTNNNSTNNTNTGSTGDNNSVGVVGPNDAEFNAVLTGFVDPQGLVDYDGIAADSDVLADLQSYVAAIGEADISGASDDEKLAFYINAYNAIVLLAVVDRLPLASVMDVPGFFDSIDHQVAGRTLTLDALENEVIRVDFAEPRIHFALVCGAASCPRIQQFAYTASNLEQTLHGATAEFIPLATTVDGSNVTTSRLFDWFAEDFVAAEGTVAAYLAVYLPNDVDALNDNPTIGFSDYSWALNTQ